MSDHCPTVLLQLIRAAAHSSLSHRAEGGKLLDAVANARGDGVEALLDRADDVLGTADARAEKAVDLIGEAEASGLMAEIEAYLRVTYGGRP